jgi:dephospho-CoA kinase
MIKVGLTGGIGCGKSVVADILRIHNIPVYESDQEAKRLMQNSATIRANLTSLMGEEAYIDDKLNRNFVASLVFDNPYLLENLNAIVHPEVISDFVNWSAAQSSSIVVVESAILFESGLATQLHKIITISSPEEIRVARTMARDKLTLEQVHKRIDAQMTDEERSQLSDFVVINDNKQAIIPQINIILASLQGLK